MVAQSVVMVIAGTATLSVYQSPANDAEIIHSFIRATAPDVVG